jgi:hypothetical protein
MEGARLVRAKVGPILVGLGVFLFVAALMLRFYAYPELAVVPSDYDRTTVLHGEDATVFDVRSLEEITTDLTTTARTLGDVEAAEEAGDNIRVWVNTSSTADADGVVRSRSIDRVAFDGTSAEAVNCCGEFLQTVEDEQEEVEHAGLVFKFPFNTGKRSYDFWDGTLREAVRIDYVETDEIQGTTVYKFEHTIEPTVTGTLDAPASVLGEPGEGNLTADRVYSNTRTLWVEPQTGVIFDRQEVQNSTLRYAGSDRVTTTAVTISYTDETVDNYVDDYASSATLLKLVRVTGPWVLGVLGVLLVAAGVFLTLRRAGGSRRR